MAAAADARAQADRLKVTEVFVSLQGEALTAGAPTVFIRLTGCPLRCGYCDTAYAFSGGDWRGIDDLIAAVESHQAFLRTTGRLVAQRQAQAQGWLAEAVRGRFGREGLKRAGALTLAPGESPFRRLAKVSAELAARYG